MPVVSRCGGMADFMTSTTTTTIACSFFFFSFPFSLLSLLACTIKIMAACFFDSIDNIRRFLWAFLKIKKKI